MISLDWILQSAIIKIDTYHVAACCFHSFLDRNGHLACFTAPETNFAFAITHNSQRSEAEDTTTLNHFSDAIHLDKLLLEIAILLLLFLIVKSHIDTLEFQTTFTCCIGQSLDAPVVLVTAAVKSHLLNPASFARFATSLPTSAAAVMFPVAPLRNSESSVDALARTLSPAGAIT